MPTIASPSPRMRPPRLRDPGKARVAATIAAARCAGLPDLKIPDPTKTPSASSCIIIAASAGVATPPAVSSGTGKRPAFGDLGDEVERSLQLLGGEVEIGAIEATQARDVAADRAQVLCCLGHIAGAGLAL